MTSFKSVAAAIAVLAVAASSLAAQSHPLAGKWQLDYSRGTRVENGESTTIMGKATLTLELRGDSLVGTWLRPADPDDTGPPQPQRFAAKAGATGAVFVLSSQITMNRNGELSTHESVVTWKLDAKGDSLEGTMERKILGSNFPSSPTPVKGVRVRA